ncbi:adenine deaminase [Paenibacillus sp. P32E]|uniref:adenine deaminase n=1 Tax=Paenibacillus sp. P32E TaxID=1349434 RepID=UPI00093E5146|nr:adenine deaminase [Paenibacillus sp. P32E]OKP84531.1 adenine deaminase [Paenibacillus sp. P32E]
MSNSTKSLLTRRIQVAGKQIPADLVIKGGTIVNVFTGELMEGDIAIVDGYIAGIGSYEGKRTADASGKWIIPGLIDGHVHIESSMLTPKEFAKVVLQHGVTAVVTDPHEIGSVAGVEGIKYMLERSRDLPVDIYVMLPSCVPATKFESCAARLEAADLSPLYADPMVLGLAEVMDFPALAGPDTGMLDKLAGALDQGKRIDGHAAGIAREDLNIFRAAGIRTDHECVHAEEAKQRLDLGLYLMIREGTAAKDLEALLPAVTAKNARRCLFVTDDKLIDDLLEEGSVDHNIRLAIRRGLDPITAIQMATLNTAECFGLQDRGAIGPGYRADLVLLDDLNSLSISQVFKQGECVVDNGGLVTGAFTENTAAEVQSSIAESCRLANVDIGDLTIPLESGNCYVIGIIPNSIVTRHLKEQVQIRDGCFAPSVQQDLLKLAVVERHNRTGNIGLGIVKGFQFSKGAIAASVAHDSHNIIAAGVSDLELLTAIRHIEAMNGGLTVVSGDKILASLPLPVAGLLSEQGYEQVYAEMKQLYAALREIGAPDHFNPFLTLSFLALPVIPALKLTDRGLFDFASYSHIGIEVID